MARAGTTTSNPPLLMVKENGRQQSHKRPVLAAIAHAGTTVHDDNIHACTALQIRDSALLLE
jgi:hypothetical protein